MTGNRDSVKSFKTKAFICAFLFCVFSLGVLFYVMTARNYASTDSAPYAVQTASDGLTELNVADITDSDVYAAYMSRTGLSHESRSAGNIFLTLSGTRSNGISDAPDIYVFLPGGVNFEDVAFENDYLNKRFVIKISGTEDIAEDFNAGDSAAENSDNANSDGGDPGVTDMNFIANNFFGENPPAADPEKISSAYLYHDASTGTLFIVFSLDSVYECVPKFENGGVSVSLISRKNLYDRAVVIDPVLSGSETDNALLLALKIKELSDNASYSTRVFLTRTKNAAAQPEKISEFIKESEACVYLAIAASGGSSTLRASAYFNDDYFIRGYGNLDFAADTLESLSAVTDISLTGVYALETSSSGADGTYASQTAVLSALKIPGALLRIDGADFSDSKNDAVSQAAKAILELLEKQE